MSGPGPDESIPVLRLVPRPALDPTAVAAGEPLRATLLAQIADVERHQAAVATGDAAPSAGRSWDADFPPELQGYGDWCNRVLQTSVGEDGGIWAGRYFRTAAILSLSPDELRDPALLDIYVSGTPWCGTSGPWARPPRPMPDDPAR